MAFVEMPSPNAALTDFPSVRERIRDATTFHHIGRKTNYMELDVTTSSGTRYILREPSVTFLDEYQNVLPFNRIITIHYWHNMSDLWIIDMRDGDGNVYVSYHDTIKDFSGRSYFLLAAAGLSAAIGIFGIIRERGISKGHA